MILLLKLQRLNLENLLSDPKNYKLDLSQQVPSELKTQRLPVSYHYYDPFAVILAHKLSLLGDKPGNTQEDVGPNRKHHRSRSFFERLLPTCLSPLGRSRGPPKHNQDVLTLGQNLQLIFHQQLDFLKKDQRALGETNLSAKRLQLRTVMNLKARGRYLDETQQFHGYIDEVPSREAQRSVIIKLQYQKEDVFERALTDVKAQESLVKKHRMLNTMIEKEQFYFNPVYQQLFRRMHSWYKYNKEDTTTFSSNLSSDIPSSLSSLNTLTPKVRYKKHRRQGSQNTRLKGITQVDFQF